MGNIFTDKDRSFVNIEKKFSKSENLEAYNLLFKRWMINKIPISIIKKKNILDVGCGSGRYSWALKKLGAKKVIGIDNGPRPKNFPKNIEYKQRSIFNLSLKEKYDFIFCNGRLSHIKNWKTALKELTKNLKKNGWIWVSLFGKGLHWSFADKIRKKMSQKDREYFEKALLVRDWKPNKIFFLIDLFFSKTRIYFSKKIIKKELKKNGYKDIFFLQRGTQKDLNEKIFQKPFLKKIYGESEIRLLARKK
jgi:SAM-dependent methyltransferase